MNAIEAKNLNFKYTKNCFSLKNINLEIKKGEIITVLGPNGAGKTTLLKILSGILENYEGDIFINDKNIKKINIKDRAKILSYVPQIFESIFDFTVYEIISMGRRPFINNFGLLGKNDKEIVEKVLIEFNLQEKKNKRFSELSGGEKRIVLLAKAICQQADILLLDEPFTFLDLYYQIELLKKIIKLNKEGKTFVLVIHDINIATEISNRVFFIKNGEIIKSGLPADTINREILKEIFKIESFIEYQNRFRIIS